jgi:hypothetical protein
MVRYYEMISRELTHTNMRWDPVIKNFTQQWQALKDRKDGEAPEVPKISKTLSIIKWTEAFTDFLHRKIGVRMVPLAYVVREVVAPGAPPPLAAGLPNSTEHGSVEGEMIARTSHTHALFRDDNSAVYYLLEEATRGTSYAPTIKPYQRSKQGREAWRSLVTQYAGDDKWEAELKRQDDLLHNRVWKGQSNFSLEKFIAQHRNAYVSMRQSAEHVTFQLPNERTRVTYLLDAIQCSDPGLQAAMAQVRTDSGEGGKMNDFEATASYMLPYDPVSKQRTTGNKRGMASISELPGADEAAISGLKESGSTKPSIGKTGVEFRYYKPVEYNELKPEQKAELKDYRENKRGSGQGKAKRPRPTQHRDRGESQQKKWIASAVEKQMAKQQADDAVDKNTESDFKTYIMSLISDTKKPVSSTVGTTSTATVNKVTLQSILRKAKR